MKIEVYKFFINLPPLLRGIFISLQYNLFRRKIHIGRRARIKRETEWRLYPNSEVFLGNSIIIGKGVAIGVVPNAKLVVGDNVGIGNRCQIVSRNHIEIGEGTILAPDVMIFDHNHTYSFENGVDQRTFIDGEVVIGKHCWIGAGSVILKDVHIGDNCVIGAGSIVTKNIPNSSVAYGVPAQVKNNNH